MKAIQLRLSDSKGLPILAYRQFEQEAPMRYLAVALVAILAMITMSAVPLPALATHSGFIPVVALRNGGYVILLRHTTVFPVTPGSQDKYPMDLKDCSAQVPLSGVGREEARKIGRAFRILDIPVGKVLASPYCRTMETGLLAFGRAEPWDALIHPAYVPIAGAPVPPPPEKRVEAIVQMFRSPTPRTNTILVTHGEVIRAAAGFAMIQGEAAIYRPDGDGFLLVARVLPTTWDAVAAEARSYSVGQTVVGALPQGTYVTHIARGDIPTSFPPPFVPLLVGHWEVTYADGHLTTAKDGSVVVEGLYAATQNQIALYKDKGSHSCDIQERDPRVPPGTPATAYSGTYNWTFDGKMLTLSKVADECAGRVVILTAHPWARRE